MRQFSWRGFVFALAVLGAGLAAPRVVEAQTGKISGIVTDAASGQPLEGVQVAVQGTGYGAVTNANGRYFIISVPPGTFTLLARRIGYQSTEVSGVQVAIDVTREVNFQMSSAANVLAVQRIVAPPTPLVEQGVTGSSQTITAEVIQALPVTSIAGVLALQQGFTEVPANTDLTSFTESRRNVLSPLRIRGGRGGSTQTLIDGIPINNVIFGDRAFDISQYAVQQLSFEKGGYEPQYGNALSGIVNIATREGGTELRGSADWQTTELAGELGSTPDELLARNIYRGYFSGPVPGTANRLRFAFAGQLDDGADNVYEFDRDVFDFDAPPPATRANPPFALDLFPGWRAGGYNSERQLFGKLTVLPTASSRVNLTVIDALRQRQPFDIDYMLVGFDPLRAPTVNSLIDTLGLAAGAQPFRAGRDVVQASIRADRTLYALGFEQRFPRTNLQVRLGRFEQERLTCNYFQGICTAGRFADRSFTGARFVREGITIGNPTTGTDDFYGGESVTSHIARVDLQSQVTDHHNLQGGVFYQRHDIDFNEQRNVGVSDVFSVSQVYRAKPYEAAGYFQDRIEYDFLTVKLGFRYDYGVAAGRGFVNPQDPSNGTTARQVCEGTAPQFGATTPYDTTISTPAGDSTFTGLVACTRFDNLLRRAAGVAQQDDFQEADPRVAFSPRIGVSFPLSERSQLFFNAGRYSQNPIYNRNPLYNSLYQNTGVGTRLSDDVSAETELKPGTQECVPTIASDAFTVTFIGNPNLLLEQATQYEIGYAGEYGRNYSLNVSVYNRDETGLSGVRRSRPTQDIGTTYQRQALPNYLVIVNQDYLTSRGIEVQFRRRIADYWGYDINYSYSKSTTNAQAPERQAEQLELEGDTVSFREIRSEIDQPHSFNASLLFEVEDDAPDFRFGNLLRNSELTVTVRAQSGLPYTPIQSFTGFGATGVGELNSGRSPATFRVDLQAGKDIQVANVRYGLFARVINLTDRKNCIQAFPTTGRCDFGTVDQRRSRNGNTALENTNSTFFDRPTFFGQRRQIYTGVRVNF